MTIIVAPSTDELIVRHQFYANISCEVNSNAKDIDGVGKRLVAFSDKFEKVRDDVQATAIRNKTLITTAVVVWTLLGSAITLYVKRGLETFDNATARIEAMERKITSLENINDQRKDLVVKVEALTRKYDELQRKLDEAEGMKK